MFWELVTFFLQNVYLFALQIVGSGFPRPLTQKEERDCFRRMAEGDRQAREDLISHNLRLVAHVAKKYYSERDDRDDLVSIGTVGLIKAVSTFNIDKNIRFSTYASRCIENEILMHFRAARRERASVYLGDPLDGAGEGDSLTIADVISDDRDIGDELERTIDLQSLRGAVDRCLFGREREIIVLRYGLGGRRALTQQETAAHMGISRSYVSRIEKKALASLREALEGRR